MLPIVQQEHNIFAVTYNDSINAHKIKVSIFKYKKCKKNVQNLGILINYFLLPNYSEMETKNSENSESKYNCIICDYKCSLLQHWKQHLSTKKHKNRFSNNVENSDTPKIYNCECGKIYSNRSGFWRHSQKCKFDKNNLEIPPITTELVLQLIEQNKELQQSLLNQNRQIIELSKQTNVNYENNTNNTFNMNFFLNETCKDAMNISDFVSSIKVNLDDLENTGRQGYIQGITHIILKNLNSLEQCFRPLHCSDVKREVLYIKDNNEWIKETNGKPILTKAIKTIANENIKQIKTWRDKNPDCADYNSKKNNLYLKIVSNSMNGLTQEESNKNINKIISNVAKEVTISRT